MGARRLVAALAAVLMPIALAACGLAVAAPAPSGAVARAPEGTYAVGVRTLLLHRGTARPLPTVVWYPAAAASEYPYTNRDTRRFDRRDVRNQPADALHVIRWISALAGLFTAGHSERLVAGIVIAGGMRDTFAGPPAALLFGHGAADSTVPVATGRSAYDKVPWPEPSSPSSGRGTVNTSSPAGPVSTRRPRRGPTFCAGRSTATPQPGTGSRTTPAGPASPS